VRVVSSGGRADQRDLSSLPRPASNARLIGCQNFMTVPILSLVVPTKNRHRYLVVLVRALLQMRTRDFEIVIHDNSEDNSEYQSLCGDINDARLRYFFDSTPMSITANCDLAVGHAQGEYVCMLGDDDGAIESIIDLAHWLKARGLDAAISPVAIYFWPGVCGALDSNSAQGMLRLPRYSGSIEIIDESRALDSVLRSGGIRIGNLPSVYQAVISKRALAALKQRAGTCFPGPSPDMASAVGLSAVINQFARVDLPVVISGSCPVSGAAEGAQHRHEGEIADRKFLAADTIPLWPSQVPFFFSGMTLWAATLIRALSLTGRDDLVAHVRFDRMLAACIVFSPTYRDRVGAVRARNPRLVSSLALSSAITWVWWLRAKALAENLLRKLLSRGDTGRQVAGLQDIGHVIEHIGGRYNDKVREALTRFSR
jgi:hypothetical protein